jgi:outer membrane protein
MKNGIVVLNVVLLIAVGVLFYLYFNSKKSNTTTLGKSEQKDSPTATVYSCQIAYFEMDSVEANFELAKEWRNELEKREDKINAEMGRLQNLYQQKYFHLQQNGASMTAAQVEAAKNELGQLDQKIRETKASMDQDYKNYYVQTQQEILSKIRKFCADYNKDKRYAIIISNEPGLVFYKDSTLDITTDLLKGLNQMYSKKKTTKKKE